MTQRAAEAPYFMELLHDLADIHDRHAEKFIGYKKILTHGLRVYHICQAVWMDFFEYRREQRARGAGYFKMPEEVISLAHIKAE